MLMAKDGVMADIDCIVGMHVDSTIPVGNLAITAGPQNATSDGFMLDFYGKSSHAARQHMGVDAIVPVVMARSVVKPDKADKKTERYSRISREAVKQCGRSKVPDVLPAMSFKQAIERMKGHQKLLMPYENGGAAFAQAIAETDVALLIGPEGGIAPEEAQAVESIGGMAVTLGNAQLSF